MKAWVRRAIRRIVSANTNSTVRIRAGSSLRSARRLRVDIAVGGADDLEDRFQGAVERLDRHLLADASEQRRGRLEQPRSSGVSAPGCGRLPSQLRWIIESTRCTRLP